MDLSKKSSRTKTKLDTLQKTIKTALAGDSGNKDINVFIGKSTLRTNEPFVILFYKALLNGLMTSAITLTDMKVLLCVLDFVSMGNVIHLTHDEVAQELNIKRQQVSKSFKTLIEHEFLIKSGKKSLFLNPTVITKESLREAKESKAYKEVQTRTLNGCPAGTAIENVRLAF
jgi:Firmicute plasmid replication protein (RepL)